MKFTASIRSATLTLGVAVALAGCHRTPTGQVVATVDGSEITRRDLITELKALGGRSDADLKAVQSGLVTTLVDRQVLIDEAKRQKLDKNPDFLAADKRQRDVLLAAMFAQSMAAHAKAPDSAAVQAFIASNPQMFGGRKILLTSQASAPAAGISPQAIAPLHGQQAVLDYLKAHHIQFNQRTATIDTLSLPKDLANKLLSLPAGEPLAIGNAGVIVFTTVLNTRDAPVPANQQAKVAESVMQRESIGKAMQDEVKQLRGSADIKYLPGFEPAKMPTG